MLRGIWLAMAMALPFAAALAAEIPTPKAASAEVDSPLARIAGQEISSDQLDQAWKKQHGSQPASDGQRQQINAVFLELIQFELMFAGATQSGYDRKPEVVQAIRRLIVDRYMADTLLPDLAAITVENDEIAAYYQAHTDSFTQPPAIKGALIQISVSSTASTEKKAELQARAQSALLEAQQLTAAAASFGSVAVKYSDHQASRYRGGDIGWINNNSRWDAQLISAFRTLSAPGELSEVLETDTGFYLLKLMELKPSRVQPLTEVRDQIVHQLFRDKRKMVKDRFFARLGSNIDVEVYTDRVDAWIEQASSRVDTPPNQPD